MRVILASTVKNIPIPRANSKTERLLKVDTCVPPINVSTTQDYKYSHTKSSYINLVISLPGRRFSKAA
jgi:hypothetical protein